MTLTFGSLFAGIGGFDLGFERAGMECKWQVEVDDYATKVLEKHWPDVKRYRDVREVGKHNLEAVDVICGGFPCQDISYAGKGAGLAGERSGLFYEVIRIAREMGPDFIVLENVSALLSRGMGEVLGTLASIGFDAEWDCLPASAFGLYHDRDRVFIVAYRQGSIQGVLEQSRSKWRSQFQSRRLVSSTQVRRMANQGDRLEGEPEVACLVHGVPDGMGKGLGNAVCPQVAEFIGRRIVEGLSQ